MSDNKLTDEDITSVTGSDSESTASAGGGDSESTASAGAGDSESTASAGGGESAAPDVADGEEENKFWIEFYDWAQYVFAMVICAIFLSVFFGRQIGVEGESMFPTLHWYDKVVISNLFFKPEYGDIIVFQPSTDEYNGTPLVKRVIAVEGQKVDINFETGEVFVDDILLHEPYINEPTNKRLQFEGPVKVPEGHIFVMGDNRNRSSDSRAASVGFVDTRCILGKVLFLVIPGSDNVHPRDWSRFGNVYD